MMKQAAKIYVLDKTDYSALYTGTVEDTPNGYYVEYEDEDGGNCVIGFSKGIATVTHTAHGYTLVLEENCAHAFQIVTPFGNLDAVAHPISVRSRKKGDSRILTLVYDLLIGKERLHHEMNLRIDLIHPTLSE